MESKKTHHPLADSVDHTPCLESLLPVSKGSIYLLTRIAMLRALELSTGKPAMVKHTAIEKPTTVALREISQGKIGYNRGKPK